MWINMQASICVYINGLVQERRNASALAMELPSFLH